MIANSIRVLSRVHPELSKLAKKPGLVRR